MKLEEGQRQEEDGSAEKVRVDVGDVLEQDEGGDAVEGAGEILQECDHVDHFGGIDWELQLNSTPKTWPGGATHEIPRETRSGAPTQKSQLQHKMGWFCNSVC